MDRDANKPSTMVIDLVVERQMTKEVLRALLHAILFHRLLGTVKPRTLEVLDVTLPAVNDGQIEQMVDDKVNACWRAVEAGRHKRAQVIIDMAEKRQKKWTVTHIFSQGEEEVSWEEWLVQGVIYIMRLFTKLLRILNVDLRQPHTDRERQALSTALSASLTDALRKILSHTSSEYGRAIVPLITNAFDGLSPFPISIHVKVDGVEITS